MTPLEQASFLGNGIGVVYYTGPTGVLIPSDPHWSRGEANGGLALKRVRNLATIARRSAYGTSATFTIVVTSAAAGNITALTIDGVAQLTPPIAITAGDEAATAASIAAAINALVASPDYSAYSVDDTVYGRCNTVGPANSNKAIVLTNTGLSTFSYPAVTAGGNDSNQYNTRIFLDLDPAADPAVLNTGSAVEITSAVAALPPYTVADVAVVGAALTADRQDRDMAIAVTGGGTINNINIADAILGDVLLVYPKAGEPAMTLATGAGNIVLSTGTSFVSATASNGIALQYRLISAGPPATYGWVEYSSRIPSTPPNLRASGSYVPLVAGIGTQAVNPAGAADTYAIGGANPYSIRMTGTVALAGNYSLALTAGGVVVGDFGFISGNGSAVTVEANTLTIQGIVIPASLALSGKWAVQWQYQSTGFSAALMADITNADIVGTAQILNGAVTNAKIATGIDGAKLSAATVPFDALSAPTQALFGGLAAVYEIVDVPFAAVRTLATVPVDVPSAVTVAGIAYIAMNFMAEIRTYAGVAYNAGDVFWLKTFGASDPQFIDSTTPQATVKTARPSNRDVTVAAGGTQVIGNAKLQITSAADLTLGTSDVRFHVWYVAVPMT